MTVTQHCPCCGLSVTMVPYDIGSGPEMSCQHCEHCWGANGQALQPLDPDVLRQYGRLAGAIDVVVDALGPSVDLIVSTETPTGACPNCPTGYDCESGHYFDGSTR